ncbi:MAG TPA: ATP-dependent Clp protease ATP-binding subunit [Candidatus Saccharimonadales bacterium]
MVDGICDIDKQQLATHAVRVRQGSREMNLELCDIHYNQLKSQQADHSPFDTPYAGASLNNSFEDNFEAFASQLGYPLPHGRESTNIDAVIPELTKELIQQAAETAVRFGRREVGTEHLLHALLKTPVVEKILNKFKLKSEGMRVYIETHTPKTSRAAIPDEPIEVTVSPHLKRVLEAALQESRKLESGYIGAEHLLIGLARETGGTGGMVLRKYGLTPASLRQKAAQVTGKDIEKGWVEATSTTPQLDKYSRDLTALAGQGELDPVIDRTSEIEAVIEVLARRTKNNPLLIGEPGVGKTAIIEDLAQRVASGNVPDILQGKRILELNLNSLIASAKYHGELEEYTKAIVDEIIANQEGLLVFVSELYAVAGAQQSDSEAGRLSVSDILWPALVRGQLHLIGATTLSNYQEYLEKDATIEEYFQPVLVAEPTVEQTIEMLCGLRDKYEAHHKIKITDQAIVAAARLSDHYLASQFLPDKAIDLVDQAAARTRINATPEKEVRAEHVLQVAANLTNIPPAELAIEQKDRLSGLEQRLHERIIGQHKAVKAVANAIRRSRAGLSQKSRPVAIFLFLGPPGVGKTELAKALAWAMFGDENTLIHLDLRKYTNRGDITRFIESSAGRRAFDQATRQVQHRLHSVLVLDNIEKSHSGVHSLLLQIFEKGRIADSKGRITDLSGAVIVATSTLNSKDEMSAQLGPELLSYIDEVIIFDSPTEEQVRQIVELQLAGIRRTARGQGIELLFDESVTDHIAQIGYSPEKGARDIRRSIRSVVETALAEQLLAGQIAQHTGVVVKYDDKNGIICDIHTTRQKRKETGETPPKSRNQ